MKQIIISMFRPEIGPILAGKLDGKRMFLRNLEALPSIHEPTLVIADFQGIELATSSFLNEAIIRLRDHLRLGRSAAYVVVGKKAEKFYEELGERMGRGEVAVFCLAL
jgi:hypothetical protein